MSIPVCTGGDAPNGASSVTFTNALAVPVTITSCTIPGWPQSPAPGGSSRTKLSQWYQDRSTLRTNPNRHVHLRYRSGVQHYRDTP